jgi:hypothetical protein
MKKILIIGPTDGSPHEAANKWVKQYDASVLCADGSYDGGLLEVTDNPDEAKSFPDAREALECWRQTAPAPFDVRPDGKPNRPLTAFSVSVE